MIKINTNSLPFNVAVATANVGIGVTVGRAVGTLMRPLLPAEIDLATKIGLNLITYATTIATSRTIFSEVSRTVDAYNETVVAYNENNNQTVYN